MLRVCFSWIHWDQSAEQGVFSFFGRRLLVDAFKNSVEALPVLVACSS